MKTEDQLDKEAMLIGYMELAERIKVKISSLDLELNGGQATFQNDVPEYVDPGSLSKTSVIGGKQLNWVCPRCQTRNVDYRTTDVECIRCGAEFGVMPGQEPIKEAKKPRRLSAAAKRKIGAAQKKRWAAAKKGK